MLLLGDQEGDGVEVIKGGPTLGTVFGWHARDWSAAALRSWGREV